jgi:hypothetical protein
VHSLDVLHDARLGTASGVVTGRSAVHLHKAPDKARTPLPNEARQEAGLKYSARSYATARRVRRIATSWYPSGSSATYTISQSPEAHREFTV